MEASIRPTAEDVEQRLTAEIIELGAEPDLIKRDATFTELDLDSLDVVELRQVVSEEYGVRLERADLETVRTLGDVIDLVVSRAA